MNFRIWRIPDTPVGGFFQIRTYSMIFARSRNENNAFLRFYRESLCSTHTVTRANSRPSGVLHEFLPLVSETRSDRLDGLVKYILFSKTFFRVWKCKKICFCAVCAMCFAVIQYFRKPCGFPLFLADRKQGGKTPAISLMGFAAAPFSCGSQFFEGTSE